MTIRRTALSEGAEFAIDWATQIPVAGPAAKLIARRAISYALRPRIQGHAVECIGHAVIDDEVERWLLSWSDFHHYETRGMRRVLDEPERGVEELSAGVTALHVIDVSGQPSTWRYAVKGYTLPRHRVPGMLVDQIPDEVMRSLAFATYGMAKGMNEAGYDMIRQGELLYSRLVIPNADDIGRVHTLRVATRIEELPKRERFCARLMQALGR